MSAIKNELQGPNGIIKKVRCELLENTKEMAKLAFEKVQEEIGQEVTKSYVQIDVDDFLKRLLKSESEIYNNISPVILERVIPYCYKNIFIENKNNTVKKYPEMNKIIQGLIDIYDGRDDMTKDNFLEGIFKLIAEPMDHISFSQKQSSKVRVGESLQNHIAKIFDIVDVQYDEQKQLKDGGTIMDFIIPSQEKSEQDLSKTMNIECQTTLKDRFRLTTGKSVGKSVQKYLVTATGCGLIRDDDFKDLTLEKVKEIVIDNDITLVVFKEVRDKIKSMIKSDLGSEDYDKLIKLSDKKIISYQELIVSHIKIIEAHWKKLNE